MKTRITERRSSAAIRVLLRAATAAVSGGDPASALAILAAARPKVDAPTLRTQVLPLEVRALTSMGRAADAEALVARDGAQAEAVRLAEAREIDFAEQTVRLHDGASEELLRYDYLILATGGRTSYFGHDDWERFAPGLKDLDDAVEIRRRVLMAFEAAEKEEQPNLHGIVQILQAGRLRR